MLNQILAVARRVLRQLLHDRRFLALSTLVPVFSIYILYIFFNAVNRPFFNPKDFVPSVAGYMVHFVTYILSAIVLVRERSQQTLSRMFVSGYRRSAIIAGYLLAYSLLATLVSMVVLVELNVLFEMGYSASTFIKMYAVLWTLAIISIALGIFVSNFARNEGQVLPTIPLVLIPSVFFSGMIVAVKDLPDWIGWFSFATPMYYANNTIDAIADGTNLMMLLWLAVYGVVVMSLAVVTLREQN